MKSKKNVFAAVLTLVLLLSIVTVSATAASANVKKSGEPVNDPVSYTHLDVYKRQTSLRARQKTLSDFAIR